MRGADFVLDPRLDADTRHVVHLPLCDVRLMNDARFPWLVLVPRRPGLVEISDLPESAQSQLWQEVNRAATALRVVSPFEKLNVGALGNIVRQLHVHVVGRREGDAAWPGPVWGSGTATPYDDDARSSVMAQLRVALDV